MYFHVCKKKYSVSPVQPIVMILVQCGSYYLPLNIFTASKGFKFHILFAITAAGVVPCGGSNKSPGISTNVPNYIFLSVNWNQLEYSEYSRDIF